VQDRARAAHREREEDGARARGRELNRSPRRPQALPRISPADYRSLAAFRYAIRKFLAFSEQAARAAGIEPQQHQLLLAIRGLPEPLRPTIRAISERLCVKHHSTVALVDKLELRGLLRRERSARDRREVLLHLTPAGEAVLRQLSVLHRQQLRTVGPAMVNVLQNIVGPGGRSRA
jgi:DNA-binding MarR family transcriptional regulator